MQTAEENGISEYDRSRLIAYYLKKTVTGLEDEYLQYHKEMIEYIRRVLVNKQYNDGGFYCHLDEGIESKNSRIEIYWYEGGSFKGFK